MYSIKNSCRAVERCRSENEWAYRTWPVELRVPWQIKSSWPVKPAKETGIGKYLLSVHSPRTRTSTDRWEVKLCLFLAVHVYVPWSAARCTVSMNRLPFATLCLMFVGSLTPSAVTTWPINDLPRQSRSIVPPNESSSRLAWEFNVDRSTQSLNRRYRVRTWRDRGTY